MPREDKGSYPSQIFIDNFWCKKLKCVYSLIYFFCCYKQTLRFFCAILIDEQGPPWMWVLFKTFFLLGLIFILKSRLVFKYLEWGSQSRLLGISVVRVECLECNHSVWIVGGCGFESHLSRKFAPTKNIDLKKKKAFPLFYMFFLQNQSVVV